MEFNDKVSVIIVNFNAGPGLIDSVRYVINDAHEVIVIDNASSDGSIELLEFFFIERSNLHVVRIAKNEGFARACNRGVALARGKYLFFLNPDCELETGAMAKLLEAFHIDSRVAMVGGLLLNLDGSEQAGGRRAIPTPWRSFVRAFGLGRLSRRWPKLFFDFYLYNEPLPKSPIEVEAISGACMLVTVDAIKEVGLLDESYFMHCEDLDWCMRMRRLGFKILFVPDAKLLHHKGVCSQSRPIFVEWHKHKGMIIFYRKHFLHQYPGILMWMVYIGVLIHFLIFILFYMMRYMSLTLRFTRD